MALSIREVSSFSRKIVFLGFNDKTLSKAKMIFQTSIIIQGTIMSLNMKAMAMEFAQIFVYHNAFHFETLLFSTS